MNRVVSAARLHLLSYQNVAIPWAVLASALAVNLLLFGSMQAGGASEEAAFTGGLVSIYIAASVSAVQLMNKHFDFAVSFGLSRRGYLLGTALFALGMALGSALLLYALLGIELATGGWGLELEFFGVAELFTANPLTAVPSYAVPMLFFIAVGALYGAINHRWGMTGVYAATLLAVLVGGLGAVLLTYTKAWASFFGWWADQPHLALLAGYPLIAAALLGAGTYLVSRRVGA
ncbi:hypothetical protein [Kineosporia babensis]|uniref:Uncharacterized protein n=1 Tax=Kineosporia babensis TaxID=499548 RepID=A0A9X1SV27_9ACTN|nr:hypothetical protein [Kineosporia babensis]MCD5313359.1 hypothetical protein [Kineosporia babensis]